MKKIVFLSGTRADFGKIKSLITKLKQRNHFTPYIFVTGMHLEQKYGYTVLEIEKSGFENIYQFSNTTSEHTMDLTLAKTIEGFSKYINTIQPDLIVIHGDRVEALAGAIVGSLNNILVAHIEGGEVSGTIDDLIRHSVSKLSHIHFVSNNQAQKRLLQMGENKKSIYIIGSPDIDIMFSDKLPALHKAKEYYDIEFSNYAIAMFHPVTTEVDNIHEYANNFVEALIESQKNYLVVYPNNDLGSKYILEKYKILKDKPNFRLIPSLRFEYFLILLKNADFIIGNSSAGIREAPYYNVATINIGTRQNKRAALDSITNVNYSKSDILQAINNIENIKFDKNKTVNFGEGKSADLFLKILQQNQIWNTEKQKEFKDITS